MVTPPSVALIVLIVAQSSSLGVFEYNFMSRAVELVKQYASTGRIKVRFGGNVIHMLRLWWQVPQFGDTVHNDSCVLSMDTPLYPVEGLYVSLEEGWKGYGRPFLDVDINNHDISSASGAVVYLHINTKLVVRVAIMYRV